MNRYGLYKYDMFDAEGTTNVCFFFGIQKVKSDYIYVRRMALGLRLLLCIRLMMSNIQVLGMYFDI